MIRKAKPWRLDTHGDDGGAASAAFASERALYAAIPIGPFEGSVHHWDGTRWELWEVVAREAPGGVSHARLGLLRAAADGRVERDTSGYMLRSYPRPDRDVTAEVEAAIADGQMVKPLLRPARWATAPVPLTGAGRTLIEETR